MDNIRENLSDFIIDEKGNELLFLLIKYRIEYDIEKHVQELNDFRKTRRALASKQNAFFDKLKRKNVDRKDKRIRQDMRQKRAWLAAGLRSASKNIEESKLGLTGDSLVQEIKLIVASFQTDPALRLKLFLILQEAILTPIFSANEEMKLPDAPKEKYPKLSQEALSKLCGFQPEMGKQIYKDTTKFINDCAELWKKVFKYSVYGTAVAVLAAGVLTPTIAVSIGSLMGLKGAAAYTAGLAFLGFGSIASGGFGMAGGLTVLIGGGALLGLSGGSGVAVAISKMSKEAIAVSVAKIANYARFLSEDLGSGRSDMKPMESLKRIKREFVRLKYNFESDLLLQEQDLDSKKNASTLNILHKALERLIES